MAPDIGGDGLATLYKGTTDCTLLNIAFSYVRILISRNYTPLCCLCCLHIVRDQTEHDTDETNRRQDIGLTADHMATQLYTRADSTASADCDYRFTYVHHNSGQTCTSTAIPRALFMFIRPQTVEIGDVLKVITVNVGGLQIQIRSRRN